MSETGKPFIRIGNTAMGPGGRTIKLSRLDHLLAKLGIKKKVKYHANSQTQTADTDPL